MSTTAQAIIEGAYNRSAANDPGKLAGDAELLAHLSRVYTRLFAALGRARPDHFAGTATVTLAGIPPAATLPSDTVDVLRVLTTTGTPVFVAAVQEATRSWQLAPCVLRRGAQLVSRNLAGDPRTGDRLVLEVLDTPAALTTLATTLDPRWPVRHTQLLIDTLAVYLSTKDTGRPSAEHQKIVAELAQGAAGLAADYSIPPSSLSWLHAPAERSGGKDA